MVVDPTAKVHPTHVLNKDVQCVPLLSSDVHNKRSVSLQQALVNLASQTHSPHQQDNKKRHEKTPQNTQKNGSYSLFCLVNGIFSIPNLVCWCASRQRIIVEAHPIDGHICTVMNPIQRRDKWRGLWEVPGQHGPIQHVSIELNTMNVAGCRRNSLEVLHVSRGLPPKPSSPPASSLQMSEDSLIPPGPGGKGHPTGCWCFPPGCEKKIFFSELQLCKGQRKEN